MDIEKAKTLLCNFRPDGADAHDVDFKEALQLATENRELGEWLAVERSRDAAFSETLSKIEIPETLRESIFNVLFVNEETEVELSRFDASFADVFESVQPPEGLRDQVIHAMELEVSEKVTTLQSQSGSRRISQKLSRFAIAAAIVLGVFAAFQFSSPFNPGEKAIAQATSADSVGEAVRPYLAGSVTLDVKSQDPVQLVSWLDDKKLPAPSSMPENLKGLKSIGCKELNIGGNPASLVCFLMDDKKVVHMIVMNEETEGENSLIQAKENCEACPVTKWASTSWGDEDQTYMLLGKMSAKELSQVF